MERGRESNIKDYAVCGFEASRLPKMPDDPINVTRLACFDGCA